MSTDANDRKVDLAGQVALVTGGGAGLGRAFALALAAAGARVALVGRTAAPLSDTVQQIERNGGRALAVPGDITAAKDVSRVVRATESQLGAVDILVNNAGTTGPLGYDWQIDPTEWFRTFEINVLGSFRCTHALLGGMVTRRRGRIINISTAAGFGRIPQMSAYGATKAALTQWTKNLAEDTRAHGIAVFAFHPGMVHTPMLDNLTAGPDVPREIGDRFRDAVKQGRTTPIERSAEMLLFLASGRADALSGRFIRAQDDEKDLLARADQIQQNDLYTVTLRM